MRWLSVLLIPLVFSLSIDYVPVKNIVKVGEEAVYRIILYNEEEFPVNVRIYGLGVEEVTLTIPPNQTVERDVRIECRAGIPYNNPVYIEYDGREFVIFPRIYGYGKREGIPSCMIQKKQIGKEEVEILLSCNFEIKKTVLKVDGIRMEGKDRFIISGISPGDYKGTLTVFYEGGKIREEFELHVKEILDVYREVRRIDGVFFRKYKIIVKNFGNKDYRGVFLLEKIGIPVQSVREENGKIILEFTVGPGEEKEMELYFINPTFLCYLLALIAVGVFWLFWRPISVEKEYLYYSKDGRTEVHVFIKIKGFPAGARDVKIIDRIPPYANIRGFETLKPELKGDMLVWDVGRVRRGEELYLNYTISFGFEVAQGRVSLPECYVVVGNRRYRVKPKLVA